MLPHIFNATSGETMRRKRTCFKGAIKVRTYSITMQSLVGLGCHAASGGEIVLHFLFFCLFVFLSITLSDNKVCECYFAMKALEFRNDIVIGIAG